MKRLLTILLLPVVAFGQPRYQIGNGEYENFILDSSAHILYALGTGLGIGSATQNIGYATAAQFQNSSGTTISAPSVAFVAAGLHTGACVDLSGNVYVTGNNEDGTWGNGTTTGGTNYFRKIDTDSLGNPFNNVVSLWMASSIFTGGATYGAIIYAIKADGTLWVWGNTQGGYRGDGTYGQVNTRPVQVPFPAGTVITKIRAQIVAIALDNAGNVWTWAGNGPNNSLLGNTSRTNYQQPVKLTLPATVKDIAGGGFFSYALLTTGPLYGWGLWPGYMGVGSAATTGYNPLNAPILLDTALNLPSPIKKLSTNYYTTYVILNDGSLWSWGANECGQAGIGSEINWPAYGSPFPYGTTTPFPFNWNQDASTAQYQSHKPKNMAPGINDWIDMSEGYDYVFYKQFMRAGPRIYSVGRNKGSVLADSTSEGNPSNGALGANYPNSWDRTLLTEIRPFQIGTTYYSTSPWCNSNPGAAGCSVFSAGANVKPTCNLSVTSSGSTVYLNGSASTDDHHISYWQFSSSILQNMGIVTGQTDTVYGVASGTYTVKLKITDNGWLSDSMSVTFTVGGSNCQCSYFFASSGSDSNPGTSGSPFQTLTKLNSLSSDTTASFYLNGGDIFTGRITGFKGKRLDSYGTGQAIVSGFITLSSWINEGGGIYSAPCPGCSIKNNLLTINGAQQPIARDPDTGYYSFETSSGHVSITDNQLAGSPDHSSGYVVIRNNHFTETTNKITSISGTTINYTSVTTQAANPGYGYFFFNDSLSLTVFGEWWLSAASGRMKVFFGGGGPGANVVKTTNIDTLLRIADGAKGITINNIDFEGAGIMAVYVGVDTNTTVSNCTMRYNGGSGILDDLSIGTRLVSNYIDQSNDNAILIQPTVKNNYTGYNTVKNSGLLPGHGRNVPGFSYTGIRQSSVGGITEFNRVDSVGYDGIYGYQDSSINNNWVTNALLVLDDGAGIYHLGFKADSTKRNIIRHNIVTDIPGNVQGTADLFNQSFCIYSDNTNVNQIIDSNVCARSAYAGVFLHNTRTTWLLDNTIYDCPSGIDMQGDNPANPMTNLIVKRNIIGLTAGANKFVVNVSSFNGYSYFNLPSFDSNYYSYPRTNATPFRTFVTSTATLKNYTQWQGVATDTRARQLDPALLFQYNTTSAPIQLTLTANYVNAVNTAFYTSTAVPAYSGLLLFQGNYIRKRRNSKINFQ